MLATSMPAHRNDIGGPGVGKGTQCKWLAEELDIVHVSVGELLRAKPKKALLEDGIDIEGRMREGLLAPVEIVQETLQSFLVKEMGEGKSVFLIDGFPRSLEQALYFEEKVGYVIWRYPHIRLTLI